MIDWEDDEQGGGQATTYSPDNPFVKRSSAPGSTPTYSPDNPFLKRDAQVGSQYSPDNPFAHPAPVRLPPTVVMAQPADVPPKPAAVDERAIGSAGGRDATRLRPDANTGATKLTGVAKFGSDVFAAGASAFEHPVETAVGAATAPVRSAATAGLFLGQKANDLVGDDGRDVNAATANEFASASGVPRIDDREAALAAAQLGTLGLGRYARMLIGRSAAVAGASPYVAGALGTTAEGAAVGASYSPDNPFVGAVLGGAAGAILNHADPYMPRFRPRTAEPIADPARLLGRPPVQATARVLEDLEAAGSHEPDYTVEDWTPSSHSPDNPFARAPEVEAAPAPEPVATSAGPTSAESPAIDERGAPNLFGETRPKTVEQGSMFGDTAGTEGSRPLAHAEAAARSELQALKTRLAGTTDPEARQWIAARVAEIERLINRDQKISADELSTRAAADATPPTAPPEQHEYSSTQLNLPAESAQRITDLGARIPDNDLATDGREATPHITVKYGLHGTDPARVRELLADVPPITVKLGKTSHFPDSGSGDVLKVDVHSPALRALNKKIADALPHTDTHPDYKPHATIAYLKPGLGAKYSGDTSLAGHTMTFDRLTFSGKDGKTVEIPLRGAPPPTVERPAPPTEPRTPGLGRVIDDDGVARLESARTPSGTRRPVASVSTRGLLQELLDLESKRADAELRAPYEVREDVSMATGGIPQIVSTKPKGGGPSRQAKALRNLADFSRITDEIYAELKTRGLDEYTVNERTNDLRSENDERAGLAGEYDARNAGRGQVTDDAGKVLFSKAPSAGKKTPPSAGSPPPARGPSTPPQGPHPTPDASGLTQDRPGIRIKELMPALRALLNPEALGPEAPGTAGTIRHEGALSFRQLTITREALRDFSRAVDKLSKPEAVRYWDAAERGASVGDPEMDAGNALLHEITQKYTDQLVELDRLTAESTIANYIGRFWSKPTTQQGYDFLRAILGRRPLMGPKSFEKHRSLEHFTDGLDAGLIPATYNYVESQLAKIAEMQRVIGAERMLRAELEHGRAKKVMDTSGKQPPMDSAGEPWERIGQHNDPAFTIFGPPSATIKETFDANVRAGLEAAIERLHGLTHTRKTSTGMRGALGYAKGGDAIVSKFGTHDGVIMHELGHILDARYGLGARLRADPRTGKEMADLAALRYEGVENPKTSFMKYVLKPEEQVANALHAFLHASERMADVAPVTKKLLEAFLASKPELAPILDIKPSLRLETGTAEMPLPGFSVLGHWYAPKSAAAVWNAHLSKGLRGNPWVDAYMAPVQAAAQLMLGLSGFHGTVIATEGIFSELALAVDDLANPGGKASRAPADVARALGAPVRTARLGRRVMQEFRVPGSHPELAKVLDAMLAGGYRGTATSELWTGERKLKLQSAFRDALTAESNGRRLWGAARLPVDALWAGLEFASSPLMGKYVPWMKTGATYAAVARALEKLPEDASLEDIHRVMGDIVKEQDYRYGQVTYENHFINNAVKHAAQMVFLAPGWTGGTALLMGRGVADAGRAGKVIAGRLGAGGGKGEAGAVPPELIGKSAAYWIGAVAGTMVINGILTYLNTGEMPRGKDFWAYRDGRTDVEGNPNRHTIPGYIMHDVYGWANHPVKLFKNKLNPVLTFMEHLAENQDYFGDQLYNPDDSPGQRVKQVTKAAVKQVAPLSVQNFIESRKRSSSGPGEMARNFFGVTPAKREFVRTPAQNQMMEYLASKTPRGATPEEKEAREKRSTLETNVRLGRASQADIDAAETRGELTTRQSNRLGNLADSNIWLDRFKRLTPDEALRVYKVAKPDEQTAWRDALDTKLARAGREDEMPPLPPSRLGKH